MYIEDFYYNLDEDYDKVIKNIDKIESRTKIYRKQDFLDFYKENYQKSENISFYNNQKSIIIYKKNMQVTPYNTDQSKKTQVEDMFDNIAPKYDLSLIHIQMCIRDSNYYW